MAAAAIPRLFSSAAHHRRLFLLLSTHQYHHLPSFHFPRASIPPSLALPPLSAAKSLLFPSFSFLHRSSIRRFSSSPAEGPSTPPSSRFTNTTASFDWSDDEDEDGGKTKTNAVAASKEVDKSKLPPPYDPFNKKPVIEEPNDPKELQEIFHRMRTEGLTNHAIKMFDALSKDGLTHEALELFSQIKDKGSMPDVVAHTAVIEAYANAGGHSKDALRTFERMLASGVTPNAYTYSVLIRGLAKDGKLKEAKKYVLEMMGKGMKPNVATYTAVFEAYVKEQRDDEARELLEEMRGKGFVPDEKAVREQLGRRGQVFRSMMSLLFGK